MTIDSLPKELLLMVTDHLPVSSIECLALTLNGQITATCLPLLQPLFARRRHFKRMTARFGQFDFDSALEFTLIDDYREELEIPDEAELRKPTASERLQLLEYLKLKEDLRWLQPLDEKTAEEMESYQNSRPLGAKELEDLQADAKSVGVELPPSFVKLFADQELLARIPSSRASYFQVSGGLRKVPASIDQGAGGYSISMYSDQQGCWYWILYLEPGAEGAHCILGSPWDSGMDQDDLWEEARISLAGTEQEKSSARPLATMQENEVTLEALGFEEWLAMTYFEEWLWFICHGEGIAESGLKEYVKRMYVREEI
ncbi:hypothetical protein BKA66DRAFT_590051 [Pyrenochaeta sp. MPI-SDFR-AT-0127]|nr:hypothetical protein BKA66DRAFT_590051 [Pyrenochaeta sp. MPI-SDFR-AT-0127]